MNVSARTLGLAAAFALLLAAAPSASLAAGTVTTTGIGGTTLQYTAGAGDLNNVTVSNVGAQITIAETGTIINTALATCTGSGTTTVVCTDPAINRLGANLGDRSDQLVNNTNLASGSTVSSGIGDDTVQGGPNGDVMFGEGGIDELNGRDGVDTLDGGPGVDTVRGGLGDDRMQEATDDVTDALDGGPGDDLFQLTFFPGGPVQGGDVMQGGPGVDRLVVGDFTNLFFGTPNAPVRITLGDGIANDGFFDPMQPQPPSNLIGIEDVDTVGSPGGSDDFVRGNAESNVLTTGPGADDVDGLVGPDSISLGDGADTVEARDGFGDRVDCGAGADTATADQLDALEGCETVTRAFVEPFGTGTGPPGVTPPATTPPGTAPSTAAAAPAPPGVDRTPPACTTSVKRSIRQRDLRKGITVMGSCNEASALQVTLTGRLRRVRRPGRLNAARAGDITLAEQALPRQEGPRTVRLKVSRSLQRALGPSARLQLRLEATDASGNRGATSTNIRFRR